MNDIIDITLPTTLRPSVLDTTLKSFCKNLFVDSDRYRVIFNVDPVGEECDPLEIVDIVKSYFNNVKYNIAKNPSFPVAFKWCWDQVESENVFHMNEDWILLRSISIDSMLNVFSIYPEVATLRLSKYKIESDPENLIFFANHCKYIAAKDCLIAAADRRHDQFGTSPQLIRGEYIKQSRSFLRIDKLPDKQFIRSKNKELFETVINKWDYAIYANPGDEALIVDIGKKWMAKNGLRRRKTKGKGPTWIKIEPSKKRTTK